MPYHEGGMMLYAIRQSKLWNGKEIPVEDRMFFRKDGMSTNTFVVYTTQHAAEKAHQYLSKWEYSGEYEILVLDNDDWRVL
jgi:hypothetical protein